MAHPMWQSWFLTIVNTHSNAGLGVTMTHGSDQLQGAEVRSHRIAACNVPW